MGGKGGGLSGRRGQGWRGKCKGSIVSGSYGYLSGQVENGESTVSADWPKLPPPDA